MSIDLEAGRRLWDAAHGSLGHDVDWLAFYKWIDENFSALVAEVERLEAERLHVLSRLGVERIEHRAEVERLQGIVLALSAEDTSRRYRRTLDGLAAHDALVAEHQP